MKLVPIPPGDVAGTEWVWLPFVKRIAKAMRDYPEHLTDKIYAGETHVIIAWNEFSRTPAALAGVRFIPRSDDRLAEILWICGDRMREWIGLLPELETYLRERQNCVGIRATLSPGLERLMKQNGYRRHHVVMAKEFTCAKE